MPDSSETRRARPQRFGAYVVAIGAVVLGMALDVHAPWGAHDRAAIKVEVDRRYQAFAPADWQVRQRANRDTLKRLSPGASLESVVASIGQPDFRDAYGGQIGPRIDVLFYRTRAHLPNGVTDKHRETTPVLFVDGRYVRQGRYRTDDPRKRVRDSHWQSRQETVKAQIRALPLGAERRSVARALGKPDFKDEIGRDVEIWFFRTRVDQDDRHTDRATETTPLVFFEDRLLAVHFAPAQITPPQRAPESGAEAAPGTATEVEPSAPARRERVDAVQEGTVAHIDRVVTA